MTEKTRQIIELRQQDKSYDEISAILGCTLKCVSRVCENYGYTYKKYKKPEKAWQREVTQLRHDGLTYKEVAEITGLKVGRVNEYCKKHGLTYSDLNQKRPYTITEKCKESYKNRDISYLHVERGPAEKSKRIIELRNLGKSYEEITEILGCTYRSVQNVCQKYNCAYKDIEKAKLKQTIISLRKSGCDYKDIAEILQIDRKKIERICNYHNCGYADLGDGTHPGHKRTDQIKGQAFIDWQKKVDERTGGRFVIVDRVLDKNRETVITVMCKECNSIRQISAVTLRAKSHSIPCFECQKKETKENNKRKVQAEREERQRQKELDRIASLYQMSFPICECGKLLTLGERVCQDCKQKKIKEAWRRKEHKRRIAMGSDFDKTITLDKLYERDHGVCYLCGKTCDWSDFQKVNGAFVVGGSYPTIEHVKPLSRGGCHTWDNVKLACHRCNSKKGARKISDSPLSFF